MPEEPTIDPELTPTGEPAEPIEPEPVVDPTAEPQPQDDPLRLSPEQQSRHKSAADLETFANQQQGEAQKAKNELEAYKQQHPTTEPTQPPPPTSDEVLEELAKDPVAFVNKRVDSAVAPLAAEVGLNKYADSGHPEIKNPEFMQAMKVVINENPALVNMSDGLDYAYFKVKNQADAAKKAHAASVTETQNAEVQNLKEGGAFVETSTTPKPTTAPKIVGGMSRAEGEKILTAQGIGFVKEEDREEY